MLCWEFSYFQSLLWKIGLITLKSFALAWNRCSQSRIGTVQFISRVKRTDGQLREFLPPGPRLYTLWDLERQTDKKMEEQRNRGQRPLFSWDCLAGVLRKLIMKWWQMSGAAGKAIPAAPRYVKRQEEHRIVERYGTSWRKSIGGFKTRKAKPSDFHLAWNPHPHNAAPCFWLDPAGKLVSLQPQWRWQQFSAQAAEAHAFRIRSPRCASPGYHPRKVLVFQFYPLGLPPFMLRNNEDLHSSWISD